MAGKAITIKSSLAILMIMALLAGCSGMELNERAFIIDLLQVGNKLHRYHYADWKRWQTDWNKRIANVHYVFDIDVTITNTGTEAGKPMIGDKK